MPRRAKCLGGCRLERPGKTTPCGRCRLERPRTPKPSEGVVWRLQNVCFGIIWDNGSKSRYMLQFVSSRAVLDDFGARQPRCSKRLVFYIVLNSLGPPRRSKLRFRCCFRIFRGPFGITSKLNPLRPVPIHPSPTKSNQFSQ